jgi:iron complex outermembrane receptor protein
MILAAILALPDVSSAQKEDFETRVVGEPDEPGVPSASVSVVRPEDDPRAGTTVAEALDALPGVRVRSIGGLGSFATVSIRGSTGAQVAVLLDGIPLATGSSGVANVGELSIESLEEIRVHRGAAPPSLGGGAIGGVVDLRTHAPGEEPMAAASATAGSFDTVRFFAHERARVGEVRAAAFAGAGYSAGDFDYHDDRGTPQNPEDDRTRVRHNADVREVEGGIGATAEIAAGWLLETGASLLAREQGLPGLGAFQSEHARLASERALAAATITRFRRTTSVGVRLAGQSRADRLDDREGEIGVGNQLTDDRTLAGSASAIGSLRTGLGRTEAAAGTDWERYSPEDALGGGAATRAVRRGLVLSVSHDAPIGGARLVVTPMLRVRRTTDDFVVEETIVGPRATAGDPPARVTVAGGAGARARAAEGVTLRAGARSDVRDPTFEELFGDRGAIVGNAALRPERAWTVDCGAQIAGGILRLDVGGFWTESEDLIQLVQNSQRTAIPVNLGRARIRGVETGLSIEGPGRMWTTFAYTLLDSENRGDVPSQRGNRIPGRPLHDARVAVGERVGPARFGVDLDVVAGNFLDPANRQETPARTLLGATAGVAPAWAAGLSLDVTLRNLLDARTESVPVRPAPPGGLAETVQPIADYAGFPLPGRSVFATLRYRHEP